MHSARPTLRCLDEDLGLPLPSAAVPLDEIDHPLLGKAAAQFSDTEAKHERIRSIDDAVLFKVKVTDHVRYRAEAGVRFARLLRATIQELIKATLRDGREHTSDFDTFTLGLQVRADDGHETYAAVRITGSVPANLATVILGHIPGCDTDGWYPEWTRVQQLRSSTPKPEGLPGDRKPASEACSLVLRKSLDGL